MPRKIQRVLIELEDKKHVVGYVLLEKHNSVKEFFESKKEDSVTIYTLDDRQDITRHKEGPIESVVYYTRTYPKSSIVNILPYSERIL